MGEKKDDGQVNMLAPHSVEAEEALLGAILINPEAVKKIIVFLQPGDFFILRNSWVWEAMMRLYSRGDDIDNLTVAEELRTQARLEDVGGSTYITYLINNTPTSLHAMAYARIIERSAIRRRLLEAAGDVAQLANSEDMDIYDVTAASRSKIDNAAYIKGQSNVKQIGAVFDPIFHEYVYGDNEKTPVHLGYRDVDKIIDTLRTLTVLAGRPGMLKTTVAENIAFNIADNGIPVGFISLEMSEEDLVKRFISIATEIKYDILLTVGMIEDEDVIRQIGEEADEKFRQHPIYIHAKRRMRITDFEPVFSEFYRLGVKVVFIDYLQLIRGSQFDKRRNKTELIEDFLAELIGLAEKYDMKIVLLSQLNRDCEYREDKRPLLSDLKSSGSIEQDAEVVIFLYRDEVYNEDTESPNVVEFIIRKNRYGKTHTAYLFFRKDVMRIENIKMHKVNLSRYSPKLDLSNY